MLNIFLPGIKICKITKITFCFQKNYWTKKLWDSEIIQCLDPTKKNLVLFAKLNLPTNCGHCDAGCSYHSNPGQIVMFDHTLFSAETEKSNKLFLLFSKYAVVIVNIRIIQNEEYQEWILCLKEKTNKCEGKNLNISWIFKKCWR